ncbi:MAG: DUF421 domain-containing protein [Bacteroidota bacterium]|nr:DUF421 domain-containing protein [Bacteroidota bacterium]
MENIFFDSWESTGRTFLITIMAYILLVVMLRTSGKRTLSKMNAFDMVVTIAMGSTLATVILNKSVALLDGVLALFLLIYLQYAITWLNVRSSTMRKLVRSSATLLVFQGELLRDEMKKQRITVEEIQEAARANGCTSTSQLKAVILETTGELNVIKELKDPDGTITELGSYPGHGGRGR